MSLRGICGGTAHTLKVELRQVFDNPLIREQPHEPFSRNGSLAFDHLFILT